QEKEILSGIASMIENGLDSFLIQEPVAQRSSGRRRSSSRSSRRSSSSSRSRRSSSSSSRSRSRRRSSSRSSSS
ncbi:MAG: hypothetical protein Q8929_13710, partial [Bacillota bacterium]|nr:hypothetical protein [Bacillota bacterium]